MVGYIEGPAPRVPPTGSKAEISPEQDLQLMVLTGIMAFQDPVKGMCMNPFYRRSYADVLNNIEKARLLWVSIWQQFSSGWVLRKLEERDYKEADLIAMSPHQLHALITEKDVPTDLTQFLF